MKRDTKRIEAMLTSTQENIALVRAEMKEGASLQHVYDELNAHERQFVARIKEINDWNKSEEAREKLKPEAEAKAKADAEAQAKAKALADTKRATAIEEFSKLKPADLKKALDHYQQELKSNPENSDAALAVEIIAGLQTKK